MQLSLLFLVGCCLVLISSTHAALISARFLVSVNLTWEGPDACLSTGISDEIKPNIPYNEAKSVQVGQCDQGAFVYTVEEGEGANSTISITPTFYSSVIEDASPPSCSISFSGSYLAPRSESVDDNVLPSCFTMESREGYHMTSYWFRLLSWTTA